MPYISFSWVPDLERAISVVIFDPWVELDAVVSTAEIVGWNESDHGAC